MKKVLIIITSIIVTIGLGYMLYVNLITMKENNTEQKELVVVTERFADTGQKYTKREFRWEENKSDNSILNYVDTVKVEKQMVSVELNDYEYCDIVIPKGDYIMDLNKSILAADGSYSIRVIDGVTMDNLAALAGLTEYTALTQYTITSAEKDRGAKVVATLIGDYAVIATIYSGDDTYSILRDSLQRNMKPYRVEDATYVENVEILKDIQSSNIYYPQVEVSINDMNINTQYYEDGFLQQTIQLDPLYLVEELWLVKLNNISGSGIDSSYKGEGYSFHSANDYYLACKEENSNTVIVLLGKGEEAKANIDYFLSNK